MSIKTAPPVNVQTNTAKPALWIQKGFHWVKKLWQGRSADEYRCSGKTPRFIGETIDMCSQQLKLIIWQSYQHPTLFR